jgi:hypothetical protein
MDDLTPKWITSWMFHGDDYVSKPLSDKAALGLAQVYGPAKPWKEPKTYTEAEILAELGIKD